MPVTYTFVMALQSKLGKNVWAIGDSITNNGSVPGNSGETLRGAIQFGASSVLGWALLQVGGRYVFGGQSSTVGFTSTQIRTTHLPNAVNAHPAVCVVLAGTNDTAADDAPATIANLKAMYAELEAAGTVPVMCTLPPQATPLPFITKVNAFIRTYARAKGFPLADYHQALVTDAGTFNPAYHVGDSVHPNPAGAKVMGGVLAAVLNSLPAEPTGTMLLGGNDPNAMLNDVTLSASGTWAPGGTGTFSATAGADGVRGNKFAITAGGAAHNEQLYGALQNQPVAGDRLSVACYLDAPVVPSGGTWSAGLYTSAGAMITGYAGMSQTLPAGSLMSWDFVVQPSQIPAAIAMRVVFTVAAADSTKLQIAQMSCLNLTSLGVVAAL